MTNETDTNAIIMIFFVLQVILYFLNLFQECLLSNYRPSCCYMIGQAKKIDTIIDTSLQFLNHTVNDDRTIIGWLYENPL